MTTSKQGTDLCAPMPWFGGKGRVAKMVWKRFGVVRNFVEPFAGSLAVLLGRPQPLAGTEKVNDMNGWLCNFWRALQADPDAVADRDSVYGEHEDFDVAHAVREWAIAHGDDPMMRIALCGYEEHASAMPADWDCVAWKAQGGYGSGSSRGTANAMRERIWFSPFCISRKERMLF